MSYTYRYVSDYVLGDAGPVLTLVNEWYENAAMAFGADPSEVKRLKKLLVGVGFKDVNERIVRIPIGEWHEDKSKYKGTRKIFKLTEHSSKREWVFIQASC